MWIGPAVSAWSSYTNCSGMRVQHQADQVGSSPGGRWCDVVYKPDGWRWSVVDPSRRGSQVATRELIGINLLERYVRTNNFFSLFFRFLVLSLFDPCCDKEKMLGGLAFKHGITSASHARIRVSIGSTDLPEEHCNGNRTFFLPVALVHNMRFGGRANQS
jgi:hypothetical protein